MIYGRGVPCVICRVQPPFRFQTFQYWPSSRYSVVALEGCSVHRRVLLW